MKYIFQVKIKDGHTIEDYSEVWKKGSAIIQKYPGAKGTRLFRKIGEPDILLAIAEWESKEARDNAMKSLRGANVETQNIWKAHNDYAEIIKIGEFEEAEWEVFPS